MLGAPARGIPVSVQVMSKPEVKEVRKANDRLPDQTEAALSPIDTGHGEKHDGHPCMMALVDQVQHIIGVGAETIEPGTNGIQPLGLGTQGVIVVGQLEQQAGAQEKDPAAQPSPD